MSSDSMRGARLKLEPLTQERFAFLVQDKGFMQTPMEKEPWTTTYFYIHPDKQVGIEVTLDFHDEVVDLYLVRLQGGQFPPEGYAVKGKWVRMLLIDTLRFNLHLQDDLIQKWAEKGQELVTTLGEGYNYACAMLNMWRDLVEQYIDMVVQQPLEVLFAPPAY